MLGTGLGRTILYVQVRDGLLSADAVRSGTNYVGLSSSAVVADSWPVVAAAIVFAAVALALALLSRNRHGGGTASRLRIGGNAAIVVGLLGITLVECGLMPTTLVLVAMAAFVAFLWLPGEVRVARACEGRPGRCRMGMACRQLDLVGNTCYIYVCDLRHTETMMGITRPPWGNPSGPFTFRQSISPLASSHKCITSKAMYSDTRIRHTTTRS